MLVLVYEMSSHLHPLFLIIHARHPHPHPHPHISKVRGVG